MSGLAHYFEDEGLATVIVALVREHIVSMRPPRALWVPFELGRPFGPPGNAGLQRRVLSEALALLDQDHPGPLLRDFSDVSIDSVDDADWRFPGTLNNDSLRAEVAGVLPVWQLARERIGRSSYGISGLKPEAAVEYIERYHSPEPMQISRGMAKGMAKVSRARFAIDDIKAFYLEAAMAEGGHPSTRQLLDWFWGDTLAGALIRDFQETARVSEDSNLELIASSLVPAGRTISFLRD
ncbi:MAG: hypothetical protein GY875_13310 [Gammaproteobacteria bacterium]|nr:hypothetical protein [Gammaproteobacteria bacterium]